MEWTTQQARALSEVSLWLKDLPNQQVFRLWGYAGTGKTTIAQELTKDVKTLFLAYTGKAASVLRKKGIPDARTIHSALYDVREADRTRLIEIEGELPTAVGETKRDLEKEYATELERCRRPRFSLNTDDSIINDYDLIFIDEASMVSGRIAQDLESFGKKILIAGDPFQLPPVKGSGYYMTGEPDVMLTEIMRQALDNPIIRWSMKVRSGEILPFGKEGSCRKIMRQKASIELIHEAGQILTGKNETRRALNRQVRKLLGHESIYPEAGERLVMLQNHKDFGVLNGVLCHTVDACKHDSHHEFLECTIHYEGEDKKIVLCTSQFNAYDYPSRGDDIDFQKRWKTPADYGYVLTVHKAQGSQWPGVVLVDDGLNKGKGVERNRWIYTAITRAETDLLIVA